MRVIDRICDFLAVLAGIYLVAIMLGIVISALARTVNLSGTWASHVFTFAEFGLLYIVMGASPWLVRPVIKMALRCLLDIVGEFFFNLVIEYRVLTKPDIHAAIDLWR